MILRLGISTCPNDTFIFGPIINRFIEHRYDIKVVLDDVEVLNNLAIKNKLDIIKVSYGVVDKVKENYMVLTAGGALGFGCGPILVSKKIRYQDNLKKAKIGIPGFNTSAFKIYRHFFSDFENDFIEMRFDKIMPAVVNGEIDAGLVIHEGRFVYKDYGLTKIVDLGDLWESKYNLPIPLGCILINKNMVNIAGDFCNLIRNSINFSSENYMKIYPFIKKYAQELNNEIIKKHIELFVNDFSLDVGKYIDELAKFVDADKSIFVG
ncbi:1,4-dihydroxy-6-naphthoate synthase [Deferribacteraceae bacterium V6Fe1]|nr:1,4-dihydroxy-6-naphthoate synthase [Deferribacteraceae bacterium V6Fe1]